MDKMDKSYDILVDGRWEYAGKLIKIENAAGSPNYKMYTFTKNNKNTSYALKNDQIMPTLYHEKDDLFYNQKHFTEPGDDIGEDKLGGFKKSRKSRKSKSKSKSRKSRKFRR
jgi:hypothetical protein